VRGRRSLRALAVAGNAAALVLLTLVLARQDVLFGRGEPTPLPAPVQQASAPASRVLLVVIDGLRADRVERLPHLAALAQTGGRGTARVGSLVPSTVAGIRALAEGVVPPPASFTEDFGASTAGRGGIFAAARAAGRTSFAAGPRLWADLYGPWLDGSVAIGTVRGDDARILRAAAAALHRHELVVAHFGTPDDAAHQGGLLSGAYDAALLRCDVALEELLRQAPPGTAVVVTSDHGVSDRGGHAGPEPAVLEVPVVVRGPGLPSGDMGTLRQRDLHRLILAPLGLAMAVPETAPRPGSPWGLVLALIAGAAATSIWSLVAAGAEPERAGFVLNAALWLALGLAFVMPWLAIGVAVVALAWPLTPWPPLPSPPVPRERGNVKETVVARDDLASAGVAPFPLSRSGGGDGRGGQGVRGLLLAGAALAALRLLDGLGALDSPLPLPSPLAQLATLLLGIASGLALRRAPGWLRGFGAVALPVLLARLLLGETPSLSTLDVREAFRLVDGPLGLPGAAAAALLRQALPFLAVLLGLLARPPADEEARGLAAAIGALLTGQAVVAALILGPDMELPGASLGLGLLVRLIGETTALFLGGAALLGWRLLRRPGGRPRPLAATPP
jgi:hypothetical protein